MSIGRSSILNDEAKRAIRDAVRTVESRTSAEIVVALRPASSTYRDADYLAGFFASFAVLLVLLFHPAEFRVETMPLDVLLAFLLGTALGAWLVPLRRFFTTRAARARAVALAAKAAFIDLGVSKTSGRTGILVYVSRLERALEVVVDIGVDTAKLGAGWNPALVRLGAAVRGRFDAQRFAAALTDLGEPLAAALPRAENDVNELPDEVA